MVRTMEVREALLEVEVGEGDEEGGEGVVIEGVEGGAEEAAEGEEEERNRIIAIAIAAMCALFLHQIEVHSGACAC